MFDFVNKMLDGYKTKLAIIGGAAAFITEVVRLLADGIQLSDWQPFIVSLSAFMALIGLGHKFMKIESALKK